ncbi:5-methylcytosine-specific restriction endonuclease McrA [Cellulomonas sp. SLBN-39]|nr:HNH endonuclease [Cellulomonas sp. SLBN-39]TQL01560.1 5-methylcytosine-specific restriction endonuclease McrA [Cellulomonas sp. SLBN-39]
MLTTAPPATTGPDRAASAPSRTLLLNASYEPLCIVPVRRAVLLLLLDKAVLEEAWDAVMHSEHLVLEAPSVVRLHRYVRVPRRSRVPVTRRAVLDRDRERCAYCAGRADTIDHVVPRSRSGPHAWENVVAACRRCNHRKADHLLSELGWTLAFTPAQPRATVLGASGHHRHEAAWEPYLEWFGEGRAEVA